MTKASFPDWVHAELTRVPEATARGTMEDRSDLRALAARYDVRNKRVVVELANGSIFAFPPALAQGLAGAQAAELSEIEVSPMGTGLHWPRLDADLTVEGLLAGVFGSRVWSRELAAKGGLVSTSATAMAGRAKGEQGAKGAKGGRPRKVIG
jgi:hypothetical protein